MLTEFKSLSVFFKPILLFVLFNLILIMIRQLFLSEFFSVSTSVLNMTELLKNRFSK